MTPEEEKIIAQYRKQRAYLKTYNRAKQRAWARLAKAHPEEFDQIFAEERAIAEDENDGG